MGDAIKSGAALKAQDYPQSFCSSSKAQEEHKEHFCCWEEQGPVPEMDEEDAEAQVLRKLKQKIPDHDDSHQVAEDMSIRKDASLRLWRQSDPYAVRRKTTVDYRFHTKEQKDFYETILLTRSL